MVRDADLYLLDEPTNNLDLFAIGWLEDYLKGLEKTMIIVTHDRYFLDKVVKEIVELNDGKLSFYPFSYSGYVTEKKKRNEAQWKAYEAQQREIKRIKEFINKMRKRKDRAPQAQERIKRLLKMKKIEPPHVKRPFSIKFPPPKRPPKQILRIKNLRVTYGNYTVFKEVNASVFRAEGIALLGPNGAGKSTLLKTIVGEKKPSLGEIQIGEGVGIGYFAQSIKEVLDPEKTLLETAEMEAPEWTQKELRDLLGAFNFRGDDVFNLVSELSGGEKARLSLALLFTHSMNFLLLDEPTNHLDISMREALEDALLRFQKLGGSILVVSHDRYFLKKLTKRIWILSDHTLREFEGSYAEYEEEMMKKKPITKEPLQITEKRRSHLEYLKRKKLEKEKNKELRAIEREIIHTEEKIDELESEVKGLEKILGDPSLYKNSSEIKEKIEHYQNGKRKLQTLYRQWEELEVCAQRVRQELKTLRDLLEDERK